jgi:predicted  nucleic acid-binding Zn-ribbon protein
MFRFRHVIAVVLGLAGASVSGLAATPPAAETIPRRVQRMLDLGWPRTLDARVEAQRRYDRLAPLAASEPRIPYAFALVQIRQYRYPEALALLDQVVAADPQNLAARELRIWLAILLKEYGKALVQMPQLVQRLPADKAAKPADRAANPAAEAEASQLELAGQLGRMCGFLAGPAQGHVDQTVLAACVEHMLSWLGESRQKAFEAGRKAVLHQFAAMGEETEITAAAAKESGENIRKHVLTELDRQADGLAAKTDAEKDKLEDLKKQLNYDLEKIRSREQQVEQQRSGVQSQVAAARQDLGTIDVQIAQFLALAGREQDPNLRQWDLAQVAAWQLQRDQRVAILAGLDRRVASLLSEQQSLVRQRRDLDRRWKQESGRLDKLETSLTRAEGEKKKFQAQPVDTSTPQVADQKRRIVALTAYVPLPISLDEEKARLIASFDTAPPKVPSGQKP